MKTTSLQSRFSDPEIESAITDLKIQLQSIQLMGRYDAETALPLTEAQWRGRIFNFIQAKVQTVINLVQQKLQPLAGMVVRERILKAASEKTSALQNEINYEEIQVQRLKNEVNQFHPNHEKWTQQKIVKVFIIAGSAADAYLMYDALRAGGLPFMPSLTYGSLVGGALALGSYHLADWIMKTRNVVKRRIKATIGLTVGAVFFTLMGHARALYYNNHIDLSLHTNDIVAQNPSAVSGWMLAGISYLLFAAALLFSALVWDTEEESITKQDYERKKKELDDLEGKIKAQKREIVAVDQKANEESAMALHRFEYGFSCEKRSMGEAEEAVATYANTYLSFKKNGECPQFLTHPPKFNFTVFFVNRKAEES